MKSANKFLTLVIHTFFNLCITKSLCNKLWSYSIELYQFLLLKKKKKMFCIEKLPEGSSGLSKAANDNPRKVYYFSCNHIASPV